MAGIADSFRRLLVRIQPPDDFTASADQRLATIKARLGATFRLVDLLKVGSFKRSTFIRGSDVDAFAVLSRDDVRWGEGYRSSSSVLDKMRADLAARYRGTPVYRDGEVVVVEFDTFKIDIAPAIYWEPGKDKYPIYYMPNADGGWMKTSPGLHNRFLLLKNARSGGRLRSTARFLKYWRMCRTPAVPISSFHIEMLLASQGTCEGVKSHAECVTDALMLLAERKCRSLQDPEGVSGYIHAASTGAKLNAAYATVAASADHAAKAFDAEQDGDVAESRRQWDIVFNGRFPR